jgi:hypothetical protein
MVMTALIVVLASNKQGASVMMFSSPFVYTIVQSSANNFYPENRSRFREIIFVVFYQHHDH